MADGATDEVLCLRTRTRDDDDVHLFFVQNNCSEPGDDGTNAPQLIAVVSVMELAMVMVDAAAANTAINNQSFDIFVLRVGDW